MIIFTISFGMIHDKVLVVLFVPHECKLFGQTVDTVDLNPISAVTWAVSVSIVLKRIVLFNTMLTSVKKDYHHVLHLRFPTP